jgi:light-harvesting protein B-800-850 alpha chain
MIYGKIWCVVKPSVGIPLFLSAVAISSFLVHLMLITHAEWLRDFYNAKPAAAATAEGPPVVALAPPEALPLR